MNSELYTAASGLLLEQTRLELVANNLANLSTAGFRAQRAFSATLDAVDIGDAETPEVVHDLVGLAGTFETGPGSVRYSGRPLDVALGPDDLLELLTDAGSRYTHAGSLRLSGDGELLGSHDHAVADTTGQSITGLSPSVTIHADGRVMDGQAEVARLHVVRDPQRVLRRQGNNLYDAGGNDAALETVEQPRLQPGWLEGSGTTALDELVQLIDAQRAFESYQKLISMTMNEVNRTAINEIAG